MKSSRSANAIGGPITFLSRFQPEAKSWRGVWGTSLFSERGWARHCSDAVATRRVRKAVGNFTASRRSAKVRLGKTSVAKRHAEAHRVHNALEDTYEAAAGPCGVCAPNAPSDTHALRRSCLNQVHHHSERNTTILRVPSAGVVVSVTSACPVGN